MHFFHSQSLICVRCASDLTPSITIAMLSRLGRLFGRKEKVEEDNEADAGTTAVEDEGREVTVELLPLHEEDTKPMPFGRYLGPIVCCTMWVDKVLPKWAMLGLCSIGALRFLQLLWAHRHAWSINRAYFVRMLVSIVLLILWLSIESFCVWVVSASYEKRLEHLPLQDNLRLWILNRWPIESPSAQWFMKSSPQVAHFGAVTIFYLVSQAWNQVPSSPPCHPCAHPAPPS